VRVNIKLVGKATLQKKRTSNSVVEKKLYKCWSKKERNEVHSTSLSAGYNIKLKRGKYLK
jgi:hypothetical protein